MPPTCTILVDWAYAFDYLSILEVKSEKLEGQSLPVSYCANHLIEQLNAKRFETIHASPEYQALFAANLAVYEGVEKARYASIEAKEVDDLNMARQKAKAALQKAFWGDTLTEVKS